MIEGIRDSFGKFILATNPGYVYVPFHQEIIVPALEDVERGKVSRLMINMPPRHGKSDIATLNFIPWWLGRHPRGNSMVCSYSFELARDFGAKIKSKMIDPTYTKIFPGAKPSRDTRGRGAIRTVSGGTAYAVGFEGAMSGKGASLFVLDDAIKNHEEAGSETRQEFLMDIYESTILARLEPTPDGFKPAIVIAMTRWAVRDFCGRVLEREGTVDKGGAWVVLKLPAEAAPGKYLWPARFSRDHYEKQKLDEDTWAALFQQDPAFSRSFWFRKEWLNFYDIAPPPGKFNTYIIIDPSGKPSKHSDMTAIHVWAAAQDERLLLVDWVYDKFDPGDRLAVILNLVRRWRPQQVLYEEYGLVNDAYYITKAMQDQNMDARFYPIPVGKKGPRHNLSKNERIKGIIPLFREGKIFLPRKFPYRQQWIGKAVDLTKIFVDDEYALFKGEGSIRHDDNLDAMSRLLEPELVLNYYSQPEEDDEKEDYQPRGTWESNY